MESPQDKNIGCARFGGKRFAPACITQDRYLGCRRLCVTLAKYIQDNPNAVKESERIYKKLAKNGSHVQMKHMGKRLPPKPGLKCTLCRFVAKTERGLSVHVNRTHSGRTLRK